MAPPATAAAAGVVVQEDMATGVTAFTATLPPFVTARVALKLWPVSTVVLLGVRVAVKEPAACTVTDAVAVPVATAAALFASVPLAEVLSVKVPAVEEEHPP